MNALLQCLSHTPLKGYVDPAIEVIQETQSVIDTLSRELKDFDPELIILFAPDHYNGFFLDTMPQLCIGIAADAVGDYGTAAGPLNVPRTIAEAFAQAAVANDIDLAVSYRMMVDHGFAQPLVELTGALDRYPVIPLFINCVAPPVISFRRARRFGEVIGAYARSLDKRVAFIGSGGLSHNPPVPQMKTATPEVAERIIAGRNPTKEAREARTQRTVEAARKFVDGSGGLHPLNPEWDQKVMQDMVGKDWSSLDQYSNEEITADAGSSAHETSAWIAANAAMNAATLGGYTAEVRYYRAIPEWIAGFGALSGSTN